MLLYINDLSFALKKAETNMYADDSMISFSSKTLDELHMASNAELVDIEKWQPISMEMDIDIKATSYPGMSSKHRL